MEDTILLIQGLILNNPATDPYPISLTLKRGSIVCLQGGPGSGKTRMLKTVLGTAGFAEGMIEKPELEDIAFIGERCIFPYSWTPETAGRVLESYHPTWDQDAYHRFLALLEVPGNKPIHTFTRDEVLSLMLAAALSRKSRLLLADEPLAGLSKERAEKVLTLLLSYKEEGGGILYGARVPLELASHTDQILDLNQKENGHGA